MIFEVALGSKLTVPSIERLPLALSLTVLQTNLQVPVLLYSAKVETSDVRSSPLGCLVR